MVRCIECAYLGVRTDSGRLTEATADFRAECWPDMPVCSRRVLDLPHLIDAAWRARGGDKTDLNPPGSAVIVISVPRPQPDDIRGPLALDRSCRQFRTWNEGIGPTEELAVARGEGNDRFARAMALTAAALSLAALIVSIVKS